MNIENINADQLTLQDLKNFRKEVKKTKHTINETKSNARKAVVFITKKRTIFFIIGTVLLFKCSQILNLVFYKITSFFITTSIVTQAVIVVSAVSLGVVPVVYDNIKVNEPLSKKNSYMSNTPFYTKDIQINKRTPTTNKYMKVLNVLNLQEQTKKGSFILIETLSGKKYTGNRWFQEESNSENMIIISKDLKKISVKIYDIKKIKVQK